MARCGLQNLRLHEAEINRLNVFPVADGDTGVNMRLTLENGIRRAEKNKNAGEYLKALSDGMLLGARGNSGVILSQIFRGIAEALKEKRTVGTEELYQALIQGYRTAYSAVIHPVEGTILTVAREGAENIRDRVHEDTLPSEMLGQYLSEMKNALEKTPDLLPVLREAGVIDSGALGHICIVEGMYGCLTGEKTEDAYGENGEPEGPGVPDLSLFSENSSFTDGYCMEFLLQRMKKEDYRQDFDLRTFSEELSALGESIVAVESGLRVKVHIHTKKPSPVILLAQQYGEFLTFKLENMQIQHNEQDLLKDEDRREIPEDPDAHFVSAERKPLAIIAVANGNGIRQMFRDLGCDIVLDGGPTMNTSTEEFLTALGRVSADTVVILADNKNIIPAAEQAAVISGRKNVRVLPAETVLEGYYALAMDVPDSSDAAWRLNQMEKGIESVDTVAVTRASRDYSFRGQKGEKGSFIGLSGDRILCGSPDDIETAVESIREQMKQKDHEIALIFRGKDVPEEREDLLREALYEAFPELEFEIADGGQPIFHWLIGLT